MNKSYLCNIASRRKSVACRITNPEKLTISEESLNELIETLKSLILIKHEKNMPK